MTFVRTPTGAIMHVDNHRALVDRARKAKSRGMLAMLEPATPIETDSRLLAAIDELAADPTKVGAAHAMASLEFAKLGGKGR